MAHLSIALAESYALSEVSDSERLHREARRLMPKMRRPSRRTTRLDGADAIPFRRKIEKMIEEGRKKRAAKVELRYMSVSSLRYRSSSRAAVEYDILRGDRPERRNVKPNGHPNHPESLCVPVPSSTSVRNATEPPPNPTSTTSSKLRLWWPTQSRKQTPT